MCSQPCTCTVHRIGDISPTLPFCIMAISIYLCLSIICGGSEGCATVCRVL